MDAKDLRNETTQRSNDGSSKFVQSVSGLPCNTNKIYDPMSSNPLAKVEAPTSRPCAVIGPDRIVPPPSTGDAYLKKSDYDPWLPMDNTYRQPPDYPHKMPSYLSPLGNISPRQTFQENMPRIMVQPTYNSKVNDDTNSSLDRHLAKPSKISVPGEPKYCDVPYSVNPINTDQKTSEMCVPNVNNPRNYPQMWHPPGVNMRPNRPYGAPELYQYPEYASCAGPRPMARPHRTITEDPGHIFNDSYYHESSIRFKPYPNIKERYPQARYEYVNNYPNPYHPSHPYPPYKYDMQKPLPPHPTHSQVPMKYVDNRMPDSVMEGYQRSLQAPFATSYRNQVIHPTYGPMLGSTLPNKIYPYPPEGPLKPVPPNKLPYDNKFYVDYDAARNKAYSGPEPFYDMRQHMKNQMVLPNYPAGNVQQMHPPMYYRKENFSSKNFDYISHLRHLDPTLNSNPLTKLSSQFSPSSVAISPSDSNTSNDTAHTQGGSLEDCGYVSQSSTASIRSMDSSANRIMHNDFQRRYNYPYPPTVRTSPLTSKPEISGNITSNKSKKDINVRQFLQMWNEGDEENGGNSKEVTSQPDFSTTKPPNQFEVAAKNHELYIYGLTNVSSEELDKYEHIQKVSKLPENIKGYNNIELLKHFEEAIESSNLNHLNQKQSIPRNYHSPVKNPLLQALPPRPLSPLDVEAKISQSVIHKEVGCNFEIKPCSPDMLNIQVATPAQKMLNERTIEKVTNPMVIKTPLHSNGNENGCNVLKQNDPSQILNENNKIPSCKMVNTPCSNNDSTNTVKANYSLQDLESNAGVCLASLPRLDNDIELNFPEVNQQFINANKESVITTTDLLATPNNDYVKRGEPGEDLESTSKTLFALETDKEFSKLSKYRKNKKGITMENSLRTDSVIIKNPENTRSMEYSSEKQLCDKKKEEYLHLDSPAEPCNNFLASDSENKKEHLPNDKALDFSLNKIDNFKFNELNQKNTNDTLPTNKQSCKIPNDIYGGALDVNFVHSKILTSKDNVVSSDITSTNYSEDFSITDNNTTQMLTSHFSENKIIKSPNDLSTIAPINIPAEVTIKESNDTLSAPHTFQNNIDTNVTNTISSSASSSINHEEHLNEDRHNAQKSALQMSEGTSNIKPNENKSLTSMSSIINPEINSEIQNSTLQFSKNKIKPNSDKSSSMSPEVIPKEYPNDKSPVYVTENNISNQTNNTRSSSISPIENQKECPLKDIKKIKKSPTHNLDTNITNKSNKFQFLNYSKDHKETLIKENSEIQKSAARISKSFSQELNKAISPSISPIISLKEYPNTEINITPSHALENDTINKSDSTLSNISQKITTSENASEICNEILKLSPKIAENINNKNLTTGLINEDLHNNKIEFQGNDDSQQCFSQTSISNSTNTKLSASQLSENVFKCTSFNESSISSIISEEVNPISKNGTQIVVSQILENFREIALKKDINNSEHSLKSTSGPIKDTHLSNNDKERSKSKNDGENIKCNEEDEHSYKENMIIDSQNLVLSHFDKNNMNLSCVLSDNLEKGNKSENGTCFEIFDLCKTELKEVSCSGMNSDNSENYRDNLNASTHMQESERTILKSFDMYENTTKCDTISPGDEFSPTNLDNSSDTSMDDSCSSISTTNTLSSVDNDGSENRRSSNNDIDSLDIELHNYNAGEDKAQIKNECSLSINAESTLDTNVISKEKNEMDHIKQILPESHVGCELDVFSKSDEVTLNYKTCHSDGENSNENNNINVNLHSVDNVICESTKVFKSVAQTEREESYSSTNTDIPMKSIRKIEGNMENEPSNINKTLMGSTGPIDALNRRINVCDEMPDYMKNAKNNSCKELNLKKELFSPWIQKLFFTSEGLCSKYAKSDTNKDASSHLNISNSNKKYGDGVIIKEEIDQQLVVISQKEVFGQTCPSTASIIIHNKEINDCDKYNDLNHKHIEEVMKHDETFTADSGIYESEVSNCENTENGDIQSNSPLHVPNNIDCDEDSIEKSLNQIHSDSPVQVENQSVNRCLKRSLSDSALGMYTNDTQDNREDYNKDDPLRSKKIKRNNNAILNVINIQNNRRNSISSVYNEENMSFCILIGNNCIISEENEEGEKLCYDISEQCFTTVHDESINEYEMESASEVILCPQEGTDEYVEPLYLNVSEEKAFEESWVDDVACIETVVSDDIAEDIVISAPSSPKDTDESDNDESNIFNCTEKVKYIYGDKMCNDDAELVETLYRTPQMMVNKTLINREPQISDDCENYSDKPTKDEHSKAHEINLNNPDECISHPDFNSQIEKENTETLNNSIDFVQKPQDENLDTCKNNNDTNLTSPIVFSSPEVSSTTTEEKNSTILLKITNYKGTRISHLSDVSSERINHNSCRFTENVNYGTYQNDSTKPRPLITKAAQKYIPPPNDTVVDDLKVKLPLPRHSLMKYKQLKISRSERNSNAIPKKDIKKKLKPKFEDVLKSIDEIQFKKHKEQNKKPKKSVPKVVIKKNENGSHYASTPTKESFNPDLTGRKWQPWVFIEKNTFIDKMAIRKKNKAIYNYRKKTYVFADRFKKYKSIPSAKFVISQPKLDDSSMGQFKYTIRLKHSY